MSDFINELIPLGVTGATAITAMIKNPDILKMIYTDLAQPSVKKVGKALETVFSLSTTILLPIKLLNDRSKIIFTKHMEDFRLKVSKIDDENINEIPPEIGIPIIDKLSYVEEESLSQMYLNLLAAAANKQQCMSVHPFFISTIGNLCPDEAVFLKNIYEHIVSKNIPYIPYLTATRKETTGKFQSSTVALIEYIINQDLLKSLQFPEKYSLYIDNLTAIGFFHKNELSSLTEKDKFYKPIHDQCKLKFDILKNSITKPNNTLAVEEHYIEISFTGREFISLVNNKEI